MIFSALEKLLTDTSFLVVASQPQLSQLVLYVTLLTITSVKPIQAQSPQSVLSSQWQIY